MKIRESAVDFIKGENTRPLTKSWILQKRDRKTPLRKKSYYAYQEVFSTLKVAETKEDTAIGGVQKSSIYKKEL